MDTLFDVHHPGNLRRNVVSRLLLRQQKIAIAAIVRYWAKALIYFVLFAYPGLKSGVTV
jgi:hypothetical protein